jgi:manganese oxidase
MSRTGESAGLTRRSLLLLGAAAPALASAAHEEHHRIAPVRSTLGGEQVPSAEQVAAALSLPVRRLQGFDPRAFLTAFDWGRASPWRKGRTLREYTLTAEDRTLEIAPGIFFPAWTYNGTVPGPTLRCREGDRVRVHFENRSQAEHTVHFHGIHPANMDGVVELVKPGDSYVYEFDAEPYGLQLYHCHVPPVDLHMNRGLYGAMIIDPQRPRPPATELVLVSAAWDVNFDQRNEIYALNGPANFYRDNPIVIRVGERVRIYLVNALEFDPINSFHLHANFFTALRQVGRGEVEDYTDVIALCQAERRILELSYRHPGTYMFHAHQNLFAEKGGMGHFRVIS